MAAEQSTNTPATAHFCPDIDHYREDARRLRRMLGELEASNEMLAGERDRLRDIVERQQTKHPMAPDRCPDCDWSNTNLMNYGGPGSSIWLCHGCAARRIRAEPPIATPPMNSDAPVGLTRGDIYDPQRIVGLTRGDIESMSRDELNAALRAAIEHSRTR